MDSREAELQRFKTEVNMIDLAERRYGFKIDFEKCTRRNVRDEKNVVMKNGTDTILVSRDHTWKFWDTRRHKSMDTKIGGDIVNLVQWQEPGKNLGEVRKILREYSGFAAPEPIRQAYKSPDGKDLDYVRNFIANRHHVSKSTYLEGRGISRETLQHPLFKNRILNGIDHAVVFPHFNENGVCGYEYRGPDRRGFTGKGVKGLWYSQIPLKVETLIFTESAIEALSHFDLFHPQNTAYFSAGGNWDPVSVGKLIESVIRKYPEAKVIAAYNNDDGGRMQAKRLEVHANAVKRGISQSLPEGEGNDWNQVLKNARAPQACQGNLKKKN